MEIHKQKNWTALTAVKVICFILIIVMAFITLNRFNSIDTTVSETGLGISIIMSDITPEQAFYNRFMLNANFFARTVLYFGSEEAILAREHLKWTFHERHASHEDWDYDGNRIIEKTVYISATLRSTSGHYQYAWFDLESVNTPEHRERAEQQAVRSQLEEFRRAMRHLETTEGLRYHLSDARGNEISNTAPNAEWFKSQAVHLVIESSNVVSSTSVNHRHWWSWEEPTWDHMVWALDEHGTLIENTPVAYLAFTSDVVSAHSEVILSARESFIRDFIVIACAVVAAMIMFAVLMMGAGRRYGVPAGTDVRFSKIDKPFLDLSGAAVFVWCTMCLFVTVEGINNVWRNSWGERNHYVFNVVLAVLAIMVMVPVLLWFMSFAKHVKAGDFWKHTLIYYIPSRFARLFVLLWAGVKLTPKVTIIALTLFFTMLFVGAVGVSTRSPGAVFILVLMATFLIALLLFRYARRIYILAEAAQKTSKGTYNETINVGKGELGSIAESINNISAGINVAVEERMKSERLKTELITNVSHDIRTPLTSIISYTDLLQKEGLKSENATEYLEILAQKSQRLKTLIDELFEAAKASTGNIDVNMTKLDIAALIEQVLGELDSSIKSSSLDLRVNLSESMYVNADGKLMWRVLENLLSNAFKYSLPNSRIYIDVFEEDMYVRIDMKNISGTELNIDPSELMDRFKRGDESRADGGSGLGLSIVQSFVTAQGGKFNITIDGDLFKASVFLQKIS